MVRAGSLRNYGYFRCIRLGVGTKPTVSTINGGDRMADFEDEDPSSSCSAQRDALNTPQNWVWGNNGIYDEVSLFSPNNSSLRLCTSFPIFFDFVGKKWKKGGVFPHKSIVSPTIDPKISHFPFGFPLNFPEIPQKAGHARQSSN